MKGKAKINQELKELGMAWAVSAEKCILPSDPIGARPTYHVHTNASE